MHCVSRGLKLEAGYYRVHKETGDKEQLLWRNTLKEELFKVEALIKNTYVQENLCWQ